MRKKRLRGSLIAEAAMVLPITLAAILLIGFQIRMQSAEETAIYDLAVRVTEEQNASALLTNGSRWICAAENHETIEINIPFFQRNLTFQERIRYRLFTGANGEGPLGADVLEEDCESVWIFPKRGECYHYEGCRIISSYPVREILSAHIRKQYSPCENCNARYLHDGMPVYVFDDGSVYHSQSCSAVTKYVEITSVQQAIQGGYRPCSYCANRNKLNEFPSEGK